MKTFLNIYEVVQIVTLIIWLYWMITSRPMSKEGGSRFIRNWKEGGYLGLIIMVIISLGLSFAAARSYLLLEFLSK